MKALPPVAGGHGTSSAPATKPEGGGDGLGDLPPLAPQPEVKSEPEVKAEVKSSADGSGVGAVTISGASSTAPGAGADVKPPASAGSSAVPGSVGGVAPAPSPAAAMGATQQGVLACGGGGGGGGAGPSGGAGSAAGQPGRKSTLPVHALVHAFHCTDDQCVQKTCPETKGVLKRMRLHVEQCRSRADPSQPPECKVCKLWQALHRTRQNSGQPSASQGGNTRAPQQQGQHGAQSHGAPPPMPGVHGGQRPAGVHPGGGQHTSPQRSQQQNAQQEALRQKLRQLDPAQVKKMLLAHVRNCQNKACPTCHKLRERIRQSRAHQQHAQGGAGGGMGGMGGYTMGMQGSFNPLVSSHSGLMSANAMGGYDGWGGGMSQGSLYSARAGMPSSARPGDGQVRAAAILHPFLASSSLLPSLPLLPPLPPSPPPSSPPPRDLMRGAHHRTHAFRSVARRAPRRTLTLADSRP